MPIQRYCLWRRRDNAPVHRNIHVIGSSGGACAGSFLFLEEVRDLAVVVPAAAILI